jgi:hypothetical protein
MVPRENLTSIVLTHQALRTVTSILPVEEVVEEAPAPSSWGWKEVGLVVLGVVIVVAWAHYCGYLNWGPKNSSSEGVQVVEKVVEGTLNPTPEVVEGVKAVRPSVSTSGARGLSLNQPRTSRAPAEVVLKTFPGDRLEAASTSHPAARRRVVQGYDPHILELLGLPPNAILGPPGLRNFLEASIEAHCRFQEGLSQGLPTHILGELLKRATEQYNAAIALMERRGFSYNSYSTTPLQELAAVAPEHTMDFYGNMLFQDFGSLKELLTSRGERYRFRIEGEIYGQISA